MQSCRSFQDAKSPLMQGRGLKLDAMNEVIYLDESPLMQGRGLKPIVALQANGH